MSSITPNIGIYLPRTGESNYTDSFNSGMINIDQHDHSGGPNKGLPISGKGLANFSVTYEKLNSNVVDPTTGIGVNSTPGLQNQLQILGILKNLYTLAGVPGVGFVGMNGATVTPLVFQNSSTVTWTNADGSGGNPTAAVNIAGLSPVTVPNGGTGITTLTAYSVLCGGTTSTANVQSVSGIGTLNQYLGSNGAGALPTWKTLPAAPAQNLLLATLTMTAAQFNNLSSVPLQIVAAPGAGNVIIPYTAWGKVVVNTTPFSGGSSVRFYYGAAAVNELNMFFDSGTFDSSFSAYYTTVAFDPPTAGMPIANLENQPVYVSVNSTDFTGGGTSVVTISLQYSIISI